MKKWKWNGMKLITGNEYKVKKGHIDYISMVRLSSRSSFIWPRVVWRFLQSSSPNQVHLDMCPPCLCTKCPPHVEQNGLFAISFSNSPDSLNLPAMTDMLSDHHHDGHRHDYLTRSCLLAWRYSATWWSATRFSASTRSTCQIKR